MGGSAGFGIQLTTNGAGTSTAVVEDNTVQSYDGNNALTLTAISGSNRLNATIRDNTLTPPLPAPGNSEANIEVASGGLGGTDTTVICIDISDADVDGNGNNTFDTPTDPPFGDMFFGTGSSGTVQIAGYVGADSDATAIQTFVRNANVGTPTVSLFVFGGAVSGAATNACQ